MSRTANKKTAPADMPEILPAVEARIVAAQDAALSVAETDDVFAAGVDIGRLEALDFITTVGTSALLSIYENLKKSKGWRYMRNPKNSHGGNFESLAEFCEVKLGKSYNRLQALAANRNLIGQDAFEQAERLGLRQVDYNAIKALPAPDQELVRRAVEEAKSRDEVLDLLQELAARHGQEKQALTKRLEETAADLKSADERIAQKSEQIERLMREKSKLDRLPPERQTDRLKSEATDIFADALARTRGDLRRALRKLSEAEGVDSVFMAGLVGQLAAELAALREEFNLPDVSNAADLQLAAETAQWAQ